jgi:glucokinase
LGIGIGVPGIVDTRTGFLREVPNLPGWSDTHVKTQIERRLQTKVVIENDANAAALGEAWLGAGRTIKNLAIFTLGTGVGGGIVLGGEVWHGMSGIAGEFGHIIVEPNGVPCSCGGRGCLEQYASVVGIMRMAREADASRDSAKLSEAASSDPEFSPKVVFNLAMQGNPAAKRIFEVVGQTLGIAIANLVYILNLPMYVVGGGVSNAWDAFAPALFQELRSRSVGFSTNVQQGKQPEAETSAHDGTIVAPAFLGSDAGLLGAARLPLLRN